MVKKNTGNITKISCKLNNFIDKKDIYKLSRKAGLQYMTVKKLYYNKFSSINLDTFARLCYVLNCEIGDLLEYNREE